MANPYDIGEAESSNDDSISLTSTLLSEQQSEYEVDCILAERLDDEETMRYLTKWTGYSEDRATWEPRGTFNQDETFEDWEAKKIRIAKGEEDAFNVTAWERRFNEIIEAMNARKDRRVMKRARFARKAKLKNSNSRAGAKASESSLSSETSSDSDTPLATVRKNQADSSSLIWTEAQKQYMMSGLRETNGPYWGQILSRYGPHGSINHELSDKSVENLEARLQVMRQEFIKAGREPPEYMHKRARPLKANSREQSIFTSRDRSGTASTEVDSSTSTDSMMEELKNQKASRTASATVKPNRTPKRKPSEKIPFKSTNNASQHASSTKSKRRDLSDERTASSTQAPIPNMLQAESKAFSSKKPLQTQKAAQRHEDFTAKPGATVVPIKNTYSGTARTPGQPQAIGSSTSNLPRTGGTGSGPARHAASRQTHPIPARPISTVSGVDVMANWGRAVEDTKKQTSSTLDPATGKDKDSKPYKTLAWRNNAIKRSTRIEHAPDPSQLVFIDPKTGKAPKKVLPALVNQTDKVVTKKTPFEQYQESLVAGDSIKQNAQQIPRELPIVSPTETNTASKGTHTEPDVEPIAESYPEQRLTQERKKVSLASSPRAAALSSENSTGEQSKDSRAIRKPHKDQIHKSDSNIHDGDPLFMTDDQGLSRVKDPKGSNVIEPIISCESQAVTPLPHGNSSPLGPPRNPPTGPRRVGYFPQIQEKYILPTTDIRPSARSTIPLLMNDIPIKERLKLGRIPDENYTFGAFAIGQSSLSLGRMKLGGFSKEVQRLLLTVKNPTRPRDMVFEFRHMCTAVEYETYFLNDVTAYRGSGYVAWSHDVDEGYQTLVEVLAYHLSTAICFANEFTMSIWPAKAPAWNFLESMLPPVPDEAVLRFVIREPMPLGLGKDIELPMSARLRRWDPEGHEAIRHKIQETSVRTDEKHINVVFRDMFDIDFNQLIASNGPQKHPPQKDFFLCFLPIGCEEYEADEAKRQSLRWRTSKEHDLFVDFLQANGAENIYSMQDLGSYDVVNNGAWDFYLNNYRSGTIIVHDACRRIDQLHSLRSLLRDGGTNVWLTSLSPMDPEIEDHPHLVRLFPHGGVILLTASLILYHPYEALRILRWFRLVQLPIKSPGIWKIAMHPRPREWLLSIQELCDGGTLQTPFGFPLQVFADIYQEIWILLDRDEEPYGLMVENWDEEVPTRDAPIVSEPFLPRGLDSWTGDTCETAALDHNAIRWSDEELIQWFAEWAGSRLDQHRKFQVVLGYSRDDETGKGVMACYKRGYGYLPQGANEPGLQEHDLFLRRDGTPIHNAWGRNFLDIMPYEECFRHHQMPDQAKLDAKHAAWRQRQRDVATRVIAEAEIEHKKEREGARHRLETVMQMARDRGATEEEVKSVGRYRLLVNRDEHGSASDKEVEDCAIDPTWKPQHPYTRLRNVLSGIEEDQEEAIAEKAREVERQKRKENLSWREKEQRWQDELKYLAQEDREKKDMQMDIDLPNGGSPEPRKRGRPELLQEEFKENSWRGNEDGEVRSHSRSRR